MGNRCCEEAPLDEPGHTVVQPMVPQGVPQELAQRLQDHAQKSEEYVQPEKDVGQNAAAEDAFPIPAPPPPVEQVAAPEKQMPAPAPPDIANVAPVCSAEGYWRSTGGIKRIRAMGGGVKTLTFETGDTVEVKIDGNAVSFETNGKTFKAELKEDSLVWSDGDVWNRVCDADGYWQSNAGIKCINGSRLRFENDTEIEIKKESAKEISFVATGTTYQAELKQDTLTWSDGDVWTRVPGVCNPDGNWRSAGGVKRIVGKKLTFETGDVVALRHDVGTNKISFDLSGKTFDAEVKENSLCWSDGDVWNREGQYRVSTGR